MWQPTHPSHTQPATEALYLQLTWLLHEPLSVLLCCTPLVTLEDWAATMERCHVLGLAIR